LFPPKATWSLSSNTRSLNPALELKPGGWPNTERRSLAQAGKEWRQRYHAEGAGNSSEVRIFRAALGVVLQIDEQVAPGGVAEIAMVAAAFPAAVTELQQHFAVGLRCEDEFLRGADPIRRAAPDAFPAHERGRRQLLDAHLKNGRKLKETEDRHAAGAGVHLHGGRPPRADAFLGGDGAINRFRRCGDADEMDEVGGHNYFMKYQFGLLARVLKVGHSTIPTFDNNFPS